MQEIDTVQQIDTVQKIDEEQGTEGTSRGRRTVSLGVLGVGLLLLLVATGLALASVVPPSPARAHGEVVALAEGASRLGGVRNLHRWTAEAVVVVAFLHLLRVFLSGGYRAPRRVNWVIGVGLLALLLVEHVLGLALPGDQAGAWALAALGLRPEEGWPASLLFVLHCLLVPLALGGLVGWHWILARRDGSPR